MIGWRLFTQDVFVCVESRSGIEGNLQIASHYPINEQRVEQELTLVAL